MNIKIVNVLTHRYNYSFKQQLIIMQFVFSDSLLTIPSHDTRDWMGIPSMFLRKTSVAEIIFGGRGWENESKDLTSPPPPPSFR